MAEYHFTVPGEPVPWTKGAPPSKGPQVPDKQAHHAGRIRQAWHESGHDGLWLEKGMPFQLIGHFYICRKKNHYGTGANARKLKTGFYASAAPRYPTGKPDGSNLLKMVEDALTHIVWADDDQTVDGNFSKRWVHHWETPHSDITVIVL